MPSIDELAALRKKAEEERASSQSRKDEEKAVDIARFRNLYGTFPARLEDFARRCKVKGLRARWDPNNMLSVSADGARLTFSLSWSGIPGQCGFEVKDSVARNSRRQRVAIDVLEDDSKLEEFLVGVLELYL